MEIISIIAGILGATFLFYLAWQNFGKEKYPTSTMLVVIGGVLLLCSFPWFQGFVKTWLTGYVNSKLNDLGSQVNEVQKTTGDMHNQLVNHQKQIDEHQKELDSVQSKIRKTQTEVSDSQSEIVHQYHDLTAMQLSLAIAQTNIETQEKQIENLDYLIQNLFSKTENEVVLGSDTNKVSLVKDWGDVKIVMFQLKYPAIPKSIQGMMSGGGLLAQSPLLPIDKNFRNVFFSNFRNVNVRDAEFNFHYVRDTRYTNLINVSYDGTNGIYLDNDYFSLP